MDNTSIIQNSILLTQPFWHFYTRAIGPNKFALDVENINLTQSFSEDDIYLEDEEIDLEEEVENVNQEYLEFIKVTRKHQAERERLKRLELRKKPELNLEEYYKDVSQVDTLVEDNLAEVPTKHQHHKNDGNNNLIAFYGGQEAYESVRSMEMNLDEIFNEKCKQLKPQYWPVMPINVKPYLNPIVNN